MSDPTFEQRGWTVLRGAVARERVEMLTALFDRVLTPPSGGQVWQQPSASMAFPALLEHFDTGLTERLCEVLGARKLRMLQDVLLCKPPGAPEVGWHTDYSYTGFLVPAKAMSVRLSLVDTTPSSGCLAVIDASHKWDLPVEVLSGETLIDGGALAGLPSHYAAEVAGNTVDVPLAAGDISLHHCRTWHMSHPNRQPDFVRKTIVVHVFDADCDIDKSRVPDRVRDFVVKERLPLLPRSG